MIRPKDKVRIVIPPKPTPAPSQASLMDEELFPDDPALELPPLTECAICGSKLAVRAVAGYHVCKSCMKTPHEAAQRLDVAVAIAARDHRNAAAQIQATYDALDQSERDRYAAYMEVRERIRANDPDVTDAERRRIAVTDAAYTDAADTRISDGLRRYWREDAHFAQINAALLDACNRRDHRLAELALCLESLGRGDEVARLYGDR